MAMEAVSNRKIRKKTAVFMTREFKRVDSSSTRNKSHPRRQFLLRFYFQLLILFLRHGMKKMTIPTERREIRITQSHICEGVLTA